MQAAFLHNELHLEYPEVFHVMSEEEQLKAYVDNNPNRWCIRDSERHIMISVFWHDSNKLLVKLTSAKSLAKRAESHSKRAYKKYGYALLGFFSREVAGTETEGFQYEYTLNGKELVGKTIVLKHGSTCYMLYWYAPKSEEGPSAELFDEFLSSLTFDSAGS